MAGLGHAVAVGAGNPLMDGSLPDRPADADRRRRRPGRACEARREPIGLARRKLRSLHERQRRLELLGSVAAFANQTSSVDEALGFAMAQICKFAGWSLGHVWLVDRSTTSRHLISSGIWQGAEGEGSLEFRRTTQAMNYAFGMDLPGRVWAARTPDWIVDIAADEDFNRAPSALAAGLISAVGLPVMVDGDVAAILEFFSCNRAQPDREHLELIAQIARQLGFVIERQRSEQKLAHDASHDPLTGLPNRAMFLDRLTRAIARNKRNPDVKFAVLFIDLDRFKMVNDSLGHLAGDGLIAEVAARFQNTIRQTDMVARPRAIAACCAESGSAADPAVLSRNMDTLSRLGGDEFTVLLEDIHQLNDAARIADRLLASLRLPFVLQGQEVYIEASIGIALSATGYNAADEVLRDADLAMYRAKALGKGRYEVFDQTMHIQATGRLALEADLRRALQNEEFILHYQPIVDLRSGTITGVEALTRWRKSPEELIYPGDFIHVAEEMGLIVHLDMWVLREACLKVRGWQMKFPREKPLSVSVNLSARQFGQPDLVPQIQAILEQAGIDPSTVRLELTESTTMTNAERAISVLQQLRSLGVRISIDDFGTGYSSLSYLHRFPLDVLKIDRSFIQQIDNTAEGLQIIHTILSLGRNLNMEVIAEGVETAEHVTALRSLGCELGQGYHFSKPVSGTAFETLLGTAPNWSS
jgi:predicted signal transduction protein with EAL and GGDEF domain